MNFQKNWKYYMQLAKQVEYVEKNCRCRVCSALQNYVQSDKCIDPSVWVVGIISVYNSLDILMQILYEVYGYNSLKLWLSIIENNIYVLRY